MEHDTLRRSKVPFLNWLRNGHFSWGENLFSQRMNIFLGLSLSEWLIIALLKEILALSMEQVTGNQWFLFRDWCQWCWLSSLYITTNLLVSQECWNHSNPFYSWFLSSVTQGMMNACFPFLGVTEISTNSFKYLFLTILWWCQNYGEYPNDHLIILQLWVHRKH